MRSVRFTILCDACVRIEYSPSGQFCDSPSLFAINGPSGALPLTDPCRDIRTASIEAGGTSLTLETPHLRLEFTPNGEPPSPRNLRVLIRHASPPAGLSVQEGGGGPSVVWTPGEINRFNLGGTIETLDGLRGAVPLSEGLLARDGWYLLDDSQRHVMQEGWARTRHELGLTDNTDWYLFAYGSDYRAAFSALAIVAGKVPLPRRAALGSWYSRYWPYTSEDYRGIVAEFDRHEVPLDVLVLDMDWHKDGWTGWSWNRSLLPDAEDLLEWLHQQRISVTLNLHPADGVGPHEDRYPEFMRALGRDPGHAERLPFDAGSGAYMNALFQQVLGPLERPKDRPSAGVDFWWLDWQQDRYTRSIPGLTNLRWLNSLFFRASMNASILTQPTHDERPAPSIARDPRGLGFSRWAGWGDHRHPVHFSGDAHTGWAMLAFQVPFSAIAGNVGCFYWSHDIGGHFGPRFEETATRWVQFGALSAALRVHSARSTTLDRRPWTYQPLFADAMRSAFQLRGMLMPAIYTAAWVSHRDTLPLLRPMYVEHPRKERAYACPQQYQLGEHLLVAPIVTPGFGPRLVGTQRVWFPPMKSVAGEAGGAGGAGGSAQSEGGAWHDLTSGERHSAGDEAVVSSPIDHIPLFAPAGVPIPMRPHTLRPASDPIDDLLVRVFPGSQGQDSTSHLYEDDGVSRAHELGQHAITRLRAQWSASKLVLDVGPTVGEFRGQRETRALSIQLGAVESAARARVNGSRAEVRHLPESAGGTLVVSVPPTSIRECVQVEIDFEPRDPAHISEHERLANLAGAFGSVGAGAGLRNAALACVQALSPSAFESRATALAIAGGIALSRRDLFDQRRWSLIDSLAWIDGGRVEIEIVDRLGPAQPASTQRTNERVIQRRSLALTGQRGRRVLDIDVPDTPMAEPEVGVRLSRVIRASFTIDGMPISIEASAESRLTPLTRFLVTGPFEWHWSGMLGERTLEAETGELDRSATFAGLDGRRVGWEPARRGPRHAVDLRQSFDPPTLACARSIIVAPQAHEARLVVLDCDEKLDILLNGERVFTQETFDSVSSAEGGATIRLSEGPNDLVVKTVNGMTGWGFSIGIEGAHALREATFDEADTSIKKA